MDLKRLLELNRDEVLGLDIGSSSVKLVQLHKDKTGWAVTAAGIADIALGDGHDNDGEVATVSAIQECLQSTGVQTPFVVCSVCGPEVAVRHFKFPSLAPAEIEGAVLLEAAQVCPFNIDDGVVDYQVIPDGQDSVSGILVAATNKLIKRKRQLVEDASLSCALMDVDGLVLLNCFREYEKPGAGGTTAILNVGSSYTNLAIMGDNNVPFVRDIACGGNDIAEQIASENGVSTESVKSILSGSENSTETELKLDDSLEQACRKLIVDVTETLRYHTAQEKSAVVEEIFVCGGFAMVKGFVELLDRRLPAKAVLWNPFEKMRCSAGQACKNIVAERGSAMAVAAGLAMRSI